MSDIRVRPWSERREYYTVGARYGLPIALGLLKDSLLKGPWNVFGEKDRSAPPAVLNDPSYGTHGYLQLKDVKLHYVANGPENAPLMLFLHGFPEFWYSWRHQITHFSKSYRTVAIDMRGYNDSDKPKGMTEYHITKLVSDIKDTIHALGRDRCILVAHDWGAAVAWAFASYHPDLIDRMIILNGTHAAAYAKHLRSSKEQFKKSWYMFFFQLPWLPEIYLKSNDYQFVVRSFLDKSGWGADMKFSDDDIAAYKYAFSKPGCLTSTLNYYRASFQCSATKYPTRDIRVPTLIIWGTADAALNTELAELSGQLVNNCKLSYIDGASHWVTQQCPEEVNKRMEEFLKLNSIPKGLSKL